MHERFQGHSESPNIPIAFIQCNYSVEQLPSDEKCEECNSVLQTGEIDAYELRGENITIKTVNKVPVFRCRSEDCIGGASFATEVTLDLISQAVPILRGKGEVLAEDLERTRATLQK